MEGREEGGPPPGRGEASGAAKEHGPRRPPGPAGAASRAAFGRVGAAAVRINGPESLACALRILVLFDHDICRSCFCSFPLPRHLSIWLPIRFRSPDPGM